MERLYQLALDREPDPDGKAFWISKLSCGEYTGADCVRGFLIVAPEFSLRFAGDEAFVEALYEVILDRPSDEGGKAFWLQCISQGRAKEDIVNDFLDTREWCNLCASYGIRSGASTGKATVPSENAISYVRRFYVYGLSHDPDPDGLNYWALGLTNETVTAAELVRDFMLGDEAGAQNLTNEEFVVRLYAVVFDRQCDTDGLIYWADKLSRGTSKLEMISLLTKTDEFSSVCSRYQVPKGKVDLPVTYVEPVIPGGERWYEGYVDPRTVRAVLITNYMDIDALVNKYYSVPLDYVPPLVSVKYSAGQLLRPEAAAAWESMHDACLAQTGQSLYLVSGYRSQATQRSSFYNAISRRGLARACRLYAWEGRSEHPLGLALDIGTASHPSISAGFTDTVAGRWVLEHGYEYGFIWRYPEGYGNITGIGTEAWHFRYVGVEVATYMHDHGIMTLEEYYGKGHGI